MDTLGRVLSWLCIAITCTAVAVLVGCAVWLKVFATMAPDCPPALLGEKLLAVYQYPDGSVSCRYVAVGSEINRAVREKGGMRK